MTTRPLHVPLADAIRAHVEAGMNLCFASTPSRSNAAVLEVARQFRGKKPGFVLTSTGFHSVMHLLPMLDLGRRYVACFFGDNYPLPRPNALYDRLHAEDKLEIWSLWSYVSALRAGALGEPWAITRSLRGSDMAADLARAGRYFEVPAPRGEGGEDATIGLVSAMRPDVTFVHAPFGDEQGNLVFSPPYSEAFWGAIAARKGVIATVERIVPPEVCARYPDAMPIPAHRVLAVCEAPFGAHPQPLFVANRFDMVGYPDDFEHYQRWRGLSRDAASFGAFSSTVLDADDTLAGYRAWVGEHRLAALRDGAPPHRPRMPSVSLSSTSSRPPPLEPRIAAGSDNPDRFARANETLVVLAARAIARRVRERGYVTLLAGIGQSFLAARMARLALAREGIPVRVMVETGMFDLDCGPQGNEFLLSYENIARARRLSSVENVLGTLVCGAENRCLGIIGAGQVDAHGAVNSTLVGGSKLLVGSGGANDIASAADEVIVLSRAGGGRLRERVEYVTSPGRAVRTVVTDLCTFTRETDAPDAWVVGDVYARLGGRTIDHALAAIREACPWSYRVPEDLIYAPVMSTKELRAVHELDPSGTYWHRED